MQFLRASVDMTLEDLGERVGYSNLDNVLVLNNIERSPDVWGQLNEIIQRAYQDESTVDWQRKMTILNKYVGDDDVFETVALLGQSDWKVLSLYDMIPGYITIPETMELPDAHDILGSGIPIGDTVYEQAMTCLSVEPHEIDPSIFNEYSSMKNTQIYTNVTSDSTFNVMNLFDIPWGEITLYSDLSGDSIDFPVFPEEIADGVQANYETMQDILYNYEPWQVYTTSGPRTVTLTFAFHRDMWSGDHRDGSANELIRFCESFCYPEYDGSAVYTDTCSLYIHGSCFIQGIITDVKPNWSGPLGLDYFPLYCELDVSFTEVSAQALNRSTIRNKGLIG